MLKPFTIRKYVWAYIYVCTYTYSHPPRSGVAGDSEAGDVTRDDAIRDINSHNHVVKMGWVVLDNLFWPRRKVNSYLMKNLKKSDK